MKKALVLVLVGMMGVGLVLIVGCGASEQPGDVGVKEETVGVKEETAETATGDYVTASVGETVSIDKLAITVYGYEFSPGDGEYETPEPGDKYLIVDFGFVNEDSVLRCIAQAFQTKIHVPAGQDYTKQNYSWPAPGLTPDDVPPGGTARGFITFEVPQETGACSIIIKTRADTLGQGPAKILEVKLQ